eukprot:6475913-Amphidinium_carterae.2
MEWQCGESVRGFLLRVSIVNGNVPCLISRRALRAVGAILNMDTCKAKFLQVTGSDFDIPLVDLASGHCALSFMNYGEIGPQTPPHCKHVCVTQGCEVALYDKELGWAPASPETGGGAYACGYYYCAERSEGPNMCVNASQGDTQNVVHSNQALDVYRVSRPRAAAIFPSGVQHAERQSVPDEAGTGVQGMGTGKHGRVSAKNRAGEQAPDCQRREQSKLHLAYAEGGAGGSSSQQGDGVRADRSEGHDGGKPQDPPATHAQRRVAHTAHTMAEHASPVAPPNEKGRLGHLAAGTSHRLAEGSERQSEGHVCAGRK